MLSITVVFASSRAARESNYNRIKMAKRIRTDAADISMEDSNSDSETDREEPTQKSGQKYDGNRVCVILIEKKVESDYFL